MVKLQGFLMHSSSSPVRQVSDLLTPLVVRLQHESTKMTTMLASLSSLSESMSVDSIAVKRDAIEKELSAMNAPAEFVHLASIPRIKALTPKRAKSRKRIGNQLRLIRTLMQTLCERIAVADIDSCATLSARNSSASCDVSSASTGLFKQVEYYKLALDVTVKTLQPMCYGRGTSTAMHQSVQLLRRVRMQLERLNALSVQVIEKFDEQEYLASNPDVRAVIDSLNVHSALEHFAVQGVYEMQQGVRRVYGVDLSVMAILPGEPLTAESLLAMMSDIESSGLFDEAFYIQQHGPRANALEHYCTSGYREDLAPNAVFDSGWYRHQYLRTSTTHTIPLYDYIVKGEQAGHQPCEYFYPHWYHARYSLPEGVSALANYLESDPQTGMNPNPVFDAQYYLQQNPDVEQSEIDPVVHYFRQGWREMRNPSAQFNTADYIQKHMDGKPQMNPVLHYLSNAPELVTGSAGNLEDESTGPVLPDDLAANLRHFANPGPAFAQQSTQTTVGLCARAKAIAFYLPQFYAFDENDAWWGDGFTEWRNVSRGAPRFTGHYQPRVPRDLGFYNLTDVETIKAQSEMAKRNGVEAFCFYYYWFDGKRLMDRPLDLFCDADIDQEFCIMWANENWTRTWDGFDSEVLIEQNYRDEDEDAFIADTVRYMSHERYTRVDGRPLFILYRPGLLPSAKETLARWRSKWEEALGVAPWILMVQGFDDMDPRVYGLDGAVEFPPHKLCVDTKDINDSLTILDPAFAGNVRSYSEVVDISLNETPPEFPLVKTVSPHWDNDARREGRGLTLHGSTPAVYERWVRGVVQYAQNNPFNGESLLFVNAWNEWAEGAYLEPDVHYGHAYLNATQRAVFGLASDQQRHKLILIGHDAYKHGAQMLLLNMARTYRQQFGMDVLVLLKTGGPLVKQYQDIARTIVLDTMEGDTLAELLRREKASVAICNTSVTGDLLPVLKQAGLNVLSLIHEMPNLIEEFDLEGNVKTIGRCADHVVFPSEIVQQGFSRFSRQTVSRQHIQPQGSYKTINYSASARARIRFNLGVGDHEKMVLNVGYADLRKGFDLFLQTAKRIIRQHPDTHFVWAGAIAEDMQRWIQSDVQDAELAERIHLTGFTDQMADYYSACDCLFLTSREDPYPTVVLEAMNVGMPVVLFKGATGFDSIIDEFGYCVELNDADATDAAILHALHEDTESAKQSRVAHVEQNCRFDDYCFTLLQMLRPDIQKISVVVPNYNYAEYMATRLESVFGQTYPVFETIVLDDCSTDNSLAAIQTVASRAKRQIQLVPNEKNSGNVFRQWRKGLSLCRGDYVWIAEADDLADSEFLAQSIHAFDDATAMSFSDSVQIDTDGSKLADSYDYYFNVIDKALFSSSFSLAGVEFVQRALSTRNSILNVSAVLWRSAALQSALEKIGGDLESFSLVGDWRLYLEVLAQKDVKLAFINKALNIHRRHQASVTHSLDHTRHVQEIMAMHQQVRKQTGNSKELDTEFENYIEELCNQFGLIVSDFREAA
jgi:lipopolysaccharide biosynthesis protein